MGEILEIKKYAKENHVPIMQEEGIAFLCDYIRTHSVKRVLEIGTAIGYSAIMFASTSPDVEVVTIERDETLFKEALVNIQKMKLEDRIQVVFEDALTANITGKFDLIFIDAAKSQYQKFFLKYQENLADGGVIVTDNLSFHGMVEHPELTQNRNTRQLIHKIQDYIEFLKNLEDYETTFYSLGDGVSVTKKKPKN